MTNPQVLIAEDNGPLRAIIAGMPTDRGVAVKHSDASRGVDHFRVGLGYSVVLCFPLMDAPWCKKVASARTGDRPSDP